MTIDSGVWCVDVVRVCLMLWCFWVAGRSVDGPWLITRGHHSELQVQEVCSLAVSHSSMNLARGVQWSSVPLFLQGDLVVGCLL